MNEVKDNWISVDKSPLYIDDGNGNWECTENGDKPFIAAVPYTDKRKPEQILWWIKPCVVEDKIGLCVIGDMDNEPAGWLLSDVTHYKLLDLTPPTK